jgi:hypothetical protein
MKQFLTENFKWILLVVTLLVVSNLLTGIRVDSLSKKDARIIRNKLDSLNSRYKELEFLHLVEVEKRRKIFLEDSLLKVEYTKKSQQDKDLIKKQQSAINKYKNLTSKVGLAKLDSAYNAENH